MRMQGMSIKYRRKRRRERAVGQSDDETDFQKDFLMVDEIPLTILELRYTDSGDENDNKRIIKRKGNVQIQFIKDKRYPLGHAL